MLFVINFFYKILRICKEDDEENANTPYLFTYACKHRCFQLLVPVSAFMSSSIPVTGKTYVKILIILVPLVQNGVILLIFFLTERCHVKLS